MVLFVESNTMECLTLGFPRARYEACQPLKMKRASIDVSKQVSNITPYKMCRMLEDNLNNAVSSAFTSRYKSNVHTIN